MSTPAFFYDELTPLGNASMPIASYPKLSVLPATNIYFVDINTEFDTQNPTLLYEDSAIRSQIKNILSTPIGTEDFEPEYGSNLPFRLFEPITPVTSWLIENDTLIAVNRWMAGRISLSRNDCSVQPLEFNQGLDGYYIRMRYRNVRTNVVTTWQFSVYR